LKHLINRGVSHSAFKVRPHQFDCYWPTCGICIARKIPRVTVCPERAKKVACHSRKVGRRRAAQLANGISLKAMGGAPSCQVGRTGDEIEGLSGAAAATLPVGAVVNWTRNYRQLPKLNVPCNVKLSVRLVNHVDHCNSRSRNSRRCGHEVISPSHSNEFLFNGIFQVESAPESVQVVHYISG